MNSTNTSAFNFNINPLASSFTVDDEKVLILDNIMLNPEALIDYASLRRFTPYPGALQGKGYPGIRLNAPQSFSDAINQSLAPIIREEFNLNHDIQAKGVSALSLITTPANKLGKTQLIPHIDSTDTNIFAVVLYLCNEEHGGTAFYRHKATGLSAVRPESKAVFEAEYYKDLDHIDYSNQYISSSTPEYEFLNLVAAKFNRAAIYRGCLLHCAHVNSNTSISSDPRTGRLTINTFFSA